jgi:hypothetical protein
MSKATETAPKKSSSKEKAPKETAAQAAAEETVATPPVPEAAPSAETPAPEAEAPQKEESDEVDPTIADVFTRLFGDAGSRILNLAPEGFELSFEVEDEAEESGCCGAVPTPEEVYEAGVQAGLLRANHPVFGIGITSPAPAPVQPSPIVIRDETTASFAHLVELKKLHDVGILTDDEFTAKKQDILKRIY